jgi:hypothetical protein
MLGVTLFVLIARHENGQMFGNLSYICLAIVVLMSLGNLGLREKYLLGISSALAIAIALLHPDPAATFRIAFTQSAFMMAFIILLGFLYEAAQSSPSVAECGQFTTRQPPGRRFFSLYLGTGLMSVLFNLGVISLLTPLVQRGVLAANPGDALNPVREQRQLSAVIRGFAWGIIWSPTALAPLTLLDLMPGIDRLQWIMMGFVIASVAMLIGWAEDYLRFRKIRAARTGPRPPPPILPRKAVTLFAAAFFWLLFLASSISRLTNDTVVYGLMVACPIMLTGWLIAQYGGLTMESLDKTRDRITTIVFEKIPGSAPIAITLASAGFIGRAASALVPAEQLVNAIGMNTMPHYLFLSLIPIAITATAFLALSPIVAAVFLGSMFGSLPQLPIDATLLALSISCGWAVAMTASPMVTVILVMARASGHDGMTLSVKWNMQFAIITIIMLFPVFWLFTGGQ